MNLRRIVLMGRMTFAEGVRARFFGVLLLISLSILLTSNFFQQFDFGTSELKFVLDFGFGAVQLFGIILCVVITSQIFFNEIDQRTAISILSRDIARWEFLAGKLIGVAALLLVFCLVTGTLLSLVLSLKEAIILKESGESVSLVEINEVYLFVILQWLKFSIIIALTLCVASLSQSSLYTMAVSFLAILACELQYLANDIYLDAESSFGRALGWVLKTVVPNLSIYNLGNQLGLNDNTAFGSAGFLFDICLHFIFYTSTFFALAVFFFRNREI